MRERRSFGQRTNLTQSRKILCEDAAVHAVHEGTDDACMTACCKFVTGKIFDKKVLKVTCKKCRVGGLRYKNKAFMTKDDEPSAIEMRMVKRHEGRRIRKRR